MISDDARAALLDSLAAGVEIRRAARAAGLTPERVRAAADADPALCRAIELAEMEASRRRRAAERAAIARPDPAPTAPAPPEPEIQAPPPEPTQPTPTVEITRPEEAARWQTAREEAARLASGMLGMLFWLDAKLVSCRMPAMSPWWRFTLGEFYGTEKRWLLVRVGRGGGKSTTLERVAGAESIFGERTIPDGQRWMWPFISVSSSDSSRRIEGLLAILRAIDIEPEKVVRALPPAIELPDSRGQPVSFVALASTIAGVSGPTTVGATIDEEAKLRDRSGNAHPATEIIASIVATFRAREGIRAIRCSSAYDLAGSHYLSVEAGSNAASHVARIGEPFLTAALDGLEDVARWEERVLRDDAAAARIRTYARTVTAGSPNVPTWVANPTITAVRAREEIEAVPHDPVRFDGLSRSAYWLREFASVSMPRRGDGRPAVDQTEGLAEANHRLAQGSAEMFAAGLSWEEQVRRGGGGRVVF